VAINSQTLLNLKRELENLDGQRHRPNFLRALGVAWSELNHSNFLSFLLDPSERHGLGDQFLKLFLREVAQVVDPRSARIAEIAELDLRDTAVKRESDNIDILLLNQQQRLAVIIENKTRTGEHDEQLQRYWETVTRKHPWAIYRSGLLLSVYGIEPSDPRFIGVSYASVCKAGESLLRSLGKSMPEWTRNYLAEYVSLIRREFMGDPQILDLAWRINLEFDEALDFVRHNRPLAHIGQKLSALIGMIPDLQCEREDAHEVSFSLTEWNRSTALVHTKQGRYKLRMIFWFRLSDDSVDLLLSPDPEARDVEDRLLSLFSRRPTAFRTRDLFERDGWKVVWSKRFVSREDLDRKSRERIMEQLETRWHAFLRTDLPRLRAAVAEEFLR
jgi:hypothetical protein